MAIQSHEFQHYLFFHTASQKTFIVGPLEIDLRYHRSLLRQKCDEALLGKPDQRFPDRGSPRPVRITDVFYAENQAGSQL